ncbi:MAG: 50S ribosomal protein L17 [Candidatus Wallbacteria bacterium]|nr:50S ribosomal protein L17 [Candidatus Wallbacteria bacterium]
MRHKMQREKLGKSIPHKKAMIRNMATSLLEVGRIRTTLPKAKVLRKYVEHLITLAKTDSLHQRKLAHAFLKTHESVKKLFTEIAPRYKERNGGYTRIYRTGVRIGDAASMALIELITEN